jgi:hypothetical protein
MHCPHCGGPFRWEYKECTIELNGLESAGPPDRLARHGGDWPEDLTMAFDLRVLRQLRREADAGWEPADATDFAALWATGRIQFRQVCRLLDLLLGSTTYCYVAVTVQLRRPISTGFTPPSSRSGTPPAARSAA